MGVPPVLFGRAGRPSHFPCGSYLILIPYWSAWPAGVGTNWQSVHQAEWAWCAVRCATIQEALKPTFILKKHYLHITTSIGISLYPQAGMNVDTLLKNADITLYRVKGWGRNTYNFYTATIP